MPWEGGGPCGGSNVGNKRLADSFIFQLCPGEIIQSKIQNTPGCESQVRLVNSPSPACLLIELLKRGVWGGPP